MPDSTKFYRKRRSRFLFLLTVTVLALGSWVLPRPQDTPAPAADQAATPAPPAQSDATQSTGPAKQPPQPSSPASEKGHPSGVSSPAEENAAGQEHQISRQEADELFRSVDEILKFASRDTALPVRHSVKRRLTSRDEVAAYVTRHMSEDEDAQRLRRSELVLKKFGLLPPDFNLETFLVALFREQVAGYYDPQTKTVNLLNWIDLEQQRPVLAHELTHALQDQSFGLEKWMKAGAADLDKKKDPTPADIENDEITAARQAVVEGQAMVVLVDYMLAPSGQSLLNSPQVVAALKAGMLVGTADTVQFRNAPIYLKEALTFPYRYGIDFETELLLKGGKEKAFAAAFTDPPRSTRQIMEPQTYLSGERLQPMSLPDFNHDFKDYDRFDIGAVGEFDVAVLIDQYAGVQASRRLYPHWRGGYYYAARPKGDPAASLALLYVSRWSSPQTAEEFAAIYANSLANRYRHAHEVTAGEIAGKEPSPNPPPQSLPHAETLERLSGTHTWMTETGPVVIETHGDTVFVTETLDDVTRQRIEHELFEPASVGNKPQLSPVRAAAGN